jgi:hypothetical protein
MDMKRILQAIDSASNKSEIINEGRGPLNRSTSAESFAMQHYNAPVSNVSEPARPSIIDKYFKAVEQELKEAAEKPNERARQLAERVTTKLEAANPAQQAAIAIAKKKKQGVAEGQEQYNYRDIAEMARQGLSNEEIAEQLGFDLTEGLRDPKDNPCWKGYKPVGTKKKGGRTVPNCVPKE